MPSAALLLLVEPDATGSSLGVSLDSLVLKVTNRSSLPSAAHLLLVEPVSTGFFLCVSLVKMVLSVKCLSSRAFRGAFASV